MAPRKVTKKLSAEDFARVLMKAQGEASAEASPGALFEAHGIGNPLAIVGEEPLRVKRLVEYFRDNFFASDHVSSRVVFGSELSSAKKVKELQLSLISTSLFSKSELIVLFGADEIKAAAAKPLIEFLKAHKTLSSFLVMTARKKKSKLLEMARTSVTVDELEGNKLGRWIEKEAKRAGAAGIESDAIKALVQCYGNDLLTLSQELAKLSLLSEGKLNKELVLEMATKRPERTSFELLTQIAAKKIPQALHLTEELLRQGVHPLQLNAFLSKAFRTMLLARSSRPAAKELEGLGKDLMNPWFMKRLPSERFTETCLQRCLNILAKLDFQLKDGNDSTPLLSAIAQLAR